MTSDDHAPSRSHPHRLDPEDYRRPGQPCHVIMGTSKRRQVLTNVGVPELVGRSLDASAQRHGCEIMAYCLLPDHLHVFVRVRPAGGDIEAFIHGFKTWTGRELARRGYRSPVWQRSFYDRHARCDNDVAGTISYVMHDPVRRGLCRSPEDWPHAFGAVTGRAGVEPSTCSLCSQVSPLAPLAAAPPARWAVPAEARGSVGEHPKGIATATFAIALPVGRMKGRQARTHAGRCLEPVL
ncbi:MAG: REP-associated tyrosine transposase, partial [Armatimonadota bacterium]